MVTNSNFVTSIQDAFASALYAVISSFLEFIPRLLAFFFLLIIGFWLARLLRNLTSKSLKAVRFERFAKSINLDGALKQADWQKSASHTLAALVYWMVIIVFFIAAVDVLGLAAINLLMIRLLGYIPNIISATIVLGIGLLLAGLVERLVKGAITPLDAKLGRLTGKLASYTVAIVAALTALSELGIAQRLIDTIFIGLTAMLALGLGLAIGLGSKDLVAKILDNWYRNVTREIKRK